MSGNNIKPNFSLDQAKDLLVHLYDLTTPEIQPLPSYDDQNFYVSCKDGNEYVLKILNSEDSMNTALIDVQIHAMAFLRQNGITTQKVIPTNTGRLWSLQEQESGFGRQEFLVRLLDYLPGVTISKVPLTPQLLYETGKMAAKIDKVLQKMEDPNIAVLDRPDYNARLSNLPLIEKYLFALDGDPLQEVVKSVLGLFTSYVAPKFSHFRKCLNHGDLSDLNILVEPDSDNSFKISGILDFGDMSSGFYISELAITIMHLMSIHPNPIKVGGAVLAGWESELPLNEFERDCLYALVLSRFCQLLCCARRALLKQPENQHIVMMYKKADNVLLDFWRMGKTHVERVWFNGTEHQSSPQESTTSK